MSGTATAADATSRRSGQALIELTISLVAILAILAALLQVGILSRVHLSVLNEARGNAGQYSIGETYQTVAPSAQLIRAWDIGADGKRYSRDDTAILGGSAFLRQSVIPITHPDELAMQVPNNAFFRIQYNEPVADEFYFVRGTADSRPVTLLPVVRTLLYRADTVRLDAESVTVWTRGID